MKALTKFLIISALNLMPIIAYSLEQANAPEPKVGNIHQYAGRVASINCSVWETVDTNKDGYVVDKCNDYLMYRNKDNLNTFKITDKSGSEVVKFQSEFPGLMFPLEVGKKWDGNYSGYTADNNAKWQSRIKCETKAIEKLKVGSESLEAFRIDCEDQWSSGVYTGISHSSRWYSPAANEVIKVTGKEDTRWNQELVNYHFTAN